MTRSQLGTIGAVLALSSLLVHGASAPVRPVRVCDIVRKPSEYQGRALMIVGRLSSRADGRFLGEDKCEAEPRPVLFELHPDRQAGPKPDGSIDIDSSAVERTIDEMKKATTLHKFPFGSGEYDRWAIVYGRVEIPKDARTAAVAGTLVIRSDSLVIFLSDQ